MATLLQQLKETTHPRGVAVVLQRALDAGGIIEVPPGTWTTTTLHLRSNTTLRLARGAALRAHPDLADYPQGEMGHCRDRQPFHLLWAEECENLTIEGDGTIDGNGMAFWDEPCVELRKRGLDPKAMGIAACYDVDVPFWRPKPQRISPLIELDRCRHVVLRDFIIQESPGWTVHFYCCDFVRVDGLTIDNHDFGPNNDGLDINGCRDVIISNCRISGCDDNIIIKATADARSSERIAVTNCILRSQCAGLGLGAETDHDIRNITFSNCVCNGVQRPLQIEMWAPGLIENVTLANITGHTLVTNGIERPIYLDIQQHTRPEPVLGRLRNVCVSNLALTTRGRLMLTAQDGAQIEDVTIRDVQLTYPEVWDWPALIPQKRSNQNSNYSPLSRAVGSVLVADNVNGLHVANLSASFPAYQPGTPKMHAIWCRNVRRGLVDCPRLTASVPGYESVVLRNSVVTVQGIGAV
jgi:hypothetical protein